jgi:hypothetical protein
MTYQITKKLYESYLKTRKGKDFKTNPYRYVANVIAAERGILGGIAILSVK